ncbi:MAG: amino acid ABC transporter permease [Acidimicrobiales bacterium]
MTAPVLADALGPRARRRALVASVVAGVAILAVVVAAAGRLQDSGQLDADKWRPLAQWSVVKFFLGGLLNTVKAASTSMAIAMTVGAVLALARLARHRPQRWLATLYVEFFRGLPLYVLILFCKFGLPRIGVQVGTFWALVIGLSLYNSSVLAEIYRAGILSLDRGQSEAASALGLGYWQSMALVIVPQAVRRMVPAIVSQLVTLLKDTSLGVLVFYEELLRRARLSAEFYQNTLQSLVAVALIYIVVNSALSAAATRLETRQRRRFGGGSIAVAGLEDLALTIARSGAADESDAAGPPG